MSETPTNAYWWLTPKYRHAEIRSLYVDQLACLWVGDTTEAICTGVEKKIDSFFDGDLEHATEMISALWKVANGDGNVADPSTPSPAVSSSQVTFFPPQYSDAYSE